MTMAQLGPGARRLAAEQSREQRPQGTNLACWPEQGEITGITSGVATVTTARGGVLEAARCRSYTPVVGDRVLLLVTSAGSVVILDALDGVPVDDL